MFLEKFVEKPFFSPIRLSGECSFDFSIFHISSTRLGLGIGRIEEESPRLTLELEQKWTT